MKRRFLCLTLCLGLLLAGCAGGTEDAAQAARAGFEALTAAPAWYVRLEYLQDDRVTFDCDTWYADGSWYQMGDLDVEEYLWTGGTCRIPGNVPVSPEEGVHLLRMNILTKLDPAGLTAESAEETPEGTRVTFSGGTGVTVICMLSSDGRLSAVERQTEMTDGTRITYRLTVLSLDEAVISDAIAKQAE